MNSLWSNSAVKTRCVFAPLSLLLLFLFSTSHVFSQDWQDLHQQGKKAYAEGKYQEAYDHFINAQRIAPENIDLSKDIGTAAYRKGEFDKAETIFSNSLSSDNQDMEAKKWHNIGNSQLKQKNYSEAIESYKKSLRLNPNNKETRYNYAEAKRRLALQQEQQNEQEQEDQEQEGDQKGDQNNSNDQNQSENQSQDNQGQNNNDAQDQSQQDQNSSSDPSKSKSKNQKANQMNDKAADKMLEDLLKKEMETKRKVQGYNKGESDKNKSGKKW